ncbi:MAG: Ig-like domain-containing protein, partial [Gemmatimonadetes bacterium]|nr:Ig-like domain-containing protein [Gemmatimonadota bacterium]
CGDGVTDGSPERPGTTPTSPVVASVEITPGSLQLPIDGSRALSATVRTQTGAVLTGRVVTWSSSDSTVVRVDRDGNATALRVGTATITAALEGRQGQSTIEVLPPPAPAAVASVAVLGDGAEMEPGESRQLSVQLRAADGTLLYGRAVTWSSSDSTIIRVHSGGQVLGVKGGTATITATSEGKSGSLTLVIPPWLVFDLHTADAQALPAVLSMTADTTDRTEFAMVVKERRVRLSGGRLWTSTVDSRYRQRYELATWERTLTYFNGNVTAATEQLVSTRTVVDEGDAKMYDMWTGQPIYESWTYAGHTFRVQHTASRGRWIRQPLPGEGGATYELIFRK